MRVIGIVGAAALLLGLGVLGAAELKSGLAVGGKIPKYMGTKLGGGEDGVELGKSLCYT